MVTGLAYEKPDDPLSYLESCIKKIKKMESRQKLAWNSFVVLPSISAQKIEPLPNKKLNKPAEHLRVPLNLKTPLPAIVSSSVPAAAEIILKKGKAWSNIVFVLGGPGR